MGTPYFCPALDPPLGGSCRKTTTLVRDHEYFIPTKFHQNPSSSSGEEVENVKSLRRTDDDGRTDDGWCALTIAHSSLRLRQTKNLVHGRIGSSGGRVVKLLTCGAIGPGFDSQTRHLNFQRLVISCFQVEIWPKDR